MKIVIQLIILPVYPIQLPVDHGQFYLISNSQKVYIYMYYVKPYVNTEPLVGRH